MCSHQRNSIEPGKRPASFLTPIVVRPSIGLCGTFVALGSSNGERALSGITQVSAHYCAVWMHAFILRLTSVCINSYSDVFLQVLINVLSSRNNMSDSVSRGRLHPLIQNNTLLVDCKFSIVYSSFLCGSFKSVL